MAKEFFNWKGLFINDDQSTPQQAQTPASTSQPVQNKFPDQQTQFPTGDVTNPFLPEIITVYEKGFESLNSSGFDFFEMYKSVMAVGATNPQSYQMAFAMGKSINTSLTKEFLIEKGRYYIAEIEKVYANYDAAGKAKKNTLDSNINAQKLSLTKSIEEIESKILQLQNELESKKAELLKIDSGNRPQYSEIQLKIDANNLAKNRILESINTVLTGINQYL